MVNGFKWRTALRLRVVQMSGLMALALFGGIAYDAHGLKQANAYYQDMAEASVMAVLDGANEVDAISAFPEGHNVHLNTKGRWTFSTEISVKKDRKILARVEGYYTSPLRKVAGTKWLGNGAVKIVKTARGKWPENYFQQALYESPVPSVLAGGAQ